MGISRQGYYKGNQAYDARLQLDQKVVDFVQQKRLRQPRLGTRKLHYLLHNQSQQELQIGRDRLFSILRQRRLLIVRKRSYHKTTDSHHRFRQHPNLLKAGPNQVVANSPEQVWVADITYLPTQQGAAYLSLVTDAFSRKIVGYHVHETLHSKSVEKAMRMALKARHTKQALVHHSDRGSQYCAHSYQDLHIKHGITCSMTDGYDCYQNAMAERVNGILKTELLVERPQNFVQAQKTVKESVYIYNNERPHLSLQYKTPDAVHRAF